MSSALAHSAFNWTMADKKTMTEKDEKMADTVTFEMINGDDNHY